MYRLKKYIEKNLRREINRVFKFDIVPVEGNANLASHLREVLHRYRIDTVLDVGANVGQFGGEIRSLGFTGDLHSLEPVKDTYAKLREAAAADPRWNTHNLALGELPGKALINVFAQSVFSSVLPANDWGAQRFPGLKPARVEEIEITTLDVFLEKAGIGAQRRILLKMDTQGYDLKVFGGARGSLGQICAMVSELSLIPIYDGMPSYFETLSAYEKGGYNVSGIYPVTRNKDLSLVEVDCVMVRRDRF